MMEFFKQFPHLEPYGNPQYFLYIIGATLPIFIGLFFKKRFALYEVLVSLFFILAMLTSIFVWLFRDFVLDLSCSWGYR